MKPKLPHCSSITSEKPWGRQSFLKQCSLQLLPAAGNFCKATLAWLKLVHKPIHIKNPHKTLLQGFYKKHSKKSKLKNCCYFTATTASHINTIPIFTAPQGSNLIYRHQVNGEFPVFRVFSNPVFVLLFVLWKDLKSPSLKYRETRETTTCMLDIHHTLEDSTFSREFKCMQPFLNVTAKWSEPRQPTKQQCSVKLFL